MKKEAIYPGTFDPITNGHLDIIYRALKIFDRVIIGVAISEEKKPMFTLPERIEMIQEAVNGLKNVEVKTFGTLLVDFCRQEKVDVVIRGLRVVSDFEYELQMGYANASLMPRLETIYLMPSLQNAFISSSVVRTILKFGGNVSHLVPSAVESAIARYGISHTFFGK